MLEEDMLQLAAVVTLACISFVDEGIIDKMFLESKVFRLSKVAANLHKRVAELESQVNPNTPLEVLKE